VTTSYWQKIKSDHSQPLSADIVIVGAGFAGLSTAYWLTEYQQDQRIIIIDRSETGSGASGRNAGFLTKGSAVFYQNLEKKWGPQAALKVFKFAEDSLKLTYDHLLQKEKIGYELTSSLTLTPSDLLSQGFDPSRYQFHFKNQNELPLELQANFTVGWENTQEYKVSPLELIRRMKLLLEKRKVTFLENTSAFDINDQGVVTESTVISCQQVVLALNGYFPQFDSFYSNWLIPRRAQMMAVELEKKMTAPHLYYDPDQRVYWRMASEQVLLIGGKRLLDPEGEVGEFDKVTSVVQTGLESYLSKQLGVKFRVLQRWSGLMGFTSTELPFIKRSSAMRETYCIGGFSGHGMGLGFKSGQEMAALVLKKQSASCFDRL
jgi:gamma-glutamylputrescine oxidase